MDVSRSNDVSWDDFVSFILLCFNLRDDLEIHGDLDELVLPIRGNPRIIHSRHPQPINCVCFCPEIDKNYQDYPIQGTYVTVSQDGTVNRWSLDFAHIRRLFIDLKQIKYESAVTVLTAVYMQDLDIMVFSTSQNQLQFYDTTAGLLTLRAIISMWENSITAMHYYVPKNTNMASEKHGQHSLLVLGDNIGNVYAMKFSSKLTGPFQKSLGRILMQWSFTALLQGVKCFTFNEEKNMLVTEGETALCAFWNIFITEKHSAIVRGHRAPIVMLVLQSNGRRLYSLDENRVIKAWSENGQHCLQSYIGLPSSVGEHSSLSVIYNSITRELIIASMQIVVLRCQPKLNELHTDGFTHSAPVTVVIFNPLFDIVITCATDGIIMSWDIETGRRRSAIHHAHTVKVNGEDFPVEITAATLSPGDQLLVTGARDGTLKVWNFNTKTCLRQMSIEHMNQVTSVIWVEGRIFVSGWNRRVTEFDDGLSMLGAKGKAWESRHSEDISAFAKRATATLATVSFSGELVLWKLDTGRPVW